MEEDITEDRLREMIENSKVTIGSVCMQLNMVKLDTARLPCSYNKYFKPKYFTLLEASKHFS